MRLPGFGSADAPRRKRHGRRLGGSGPRTKSPTKSPTKRPRSRRKPPEPRPALRIRYPRLGRRAALGALAVLLAACAVLAGRWGTQWIAVQPFLAVREIRVDGSNRVAVAELEELSGVVAGAPWLTLDTGWARFHLESHPWVRTARVRRPWPGTVVIRVTECEPLAVVHVDQRRYGLCDDLRIVPLEGENEDLPVIRDFASGLGADPKGLERGLEYVRALRKLGVTHGVRLDLRRDGRDLIMLPDRGFVAEVRMPLAADRAARNVAAFLERLDGEGGARGTLRLISDGTAVWRASV